MGRLDHAGGVVFLHLSRGRGVTATTPVAQRVEVVGLRGGKEQGKGRDHYGLSFVDRPELPCMWAFEQTGTIVWPTVLWSSGFVTITIGTV